MGLPLYHVRRTIEESGLPFDDKSSIIYVNGQIQDGTPLGQLMHDFFCRDAKDMHYKILADRMMFFKEYKGGVHSMCEVMEEWAKEIKQDVKMEEWVTSTRNLMKNLNLTAKQAMDALDVPITKQKQVATLL